MSPALNGNFTAASQPRSSYLVASNNAQPRA
jgi:hypothetical protein